VVLEDTLTPPEGPPFSQATIDISVSGFEGHAPHSYPHYNRWAEIKRRLPSGEWPSLPVSSDWIQGDYYDDDVNYINWSLDEMTITFYDVPLEPGENVFKIAVTSTADPDDGFDGTYGEMKFTYTRE
jgi:hypothetical protein